MTDLTRRGLLLASVMGAVTVGLAGCRPEPSPRAALAMPSAAPFHTRPFVSGASCRGVADGTFETWRGLEVGLAGTWVYDGALWPLDSGGEYRRWTGDVDFSPQYKFDGRFSWAELSRGDYDDRLVADLTALRTAWGSRRATLYYRFQHEFNGDWYPWSVSDEDIPDFISGWRRFAALFRSVFGYDERFRIVWSPNAGTVSANIRNIADAYPGSRYLDVIGIDIYDFFASTTEGEFDASIAAVDDGGGPVGLGAWRQFAEESGRPLALTEWGQQHGDNPVYMRKMHEFLDTWRYTGKGSPAGRIVYDIYFNERIGDDDTPGADGDFIVQDGGVDHPGRPNAAAAYRELWSGWDLAAPNRPTTPP